MCLATKIQLFKKSEIFSIIRFTIVSVRELTKIFYYPPMQAQDNSKWKDYNWLKKIVKWVCMF